MANELIYQSSSSYDFCTEGTSYLTSFCTFGWDHLIGHTRKGGLRFVNVNIAQGTSVYQAILYIRIDDVEVDNDANIKFKIYGIDEDNTANFGSNPFGRTKTSAYISKEWGSPTDQSWGGCDVTSIVNEILGRGGWSSGNAMGFLIEDNGTAHDQNRLVVDQYGSGLDSYLMIKQTNVDFTPTPKTVVAPIFPATSNYGIKISKRGVNVSDASEDELLYTSRKKIFKVIDEAQITTTAATHNILHILPYAPACLVYANFNNKKFKLNRMFDPNYDDPVTGVNGGIGYFGSDSTKLSITAGSGTDVYYYIFIDPLT